MYFSIKWDEVSLLSTDNLTHLFDGWSTHNKGLLWWPTIVYVLKMESSKTSNGEINFFVHVIYTFIWKYYVINMYA